MLRKRNMQVLSDILDSMTSILHSTTWQEAQHLLLDNPTFAEDAELLSKSRFGKHLVEGKRESPGDSGGPSV